MCWSCFTVGSDVTHIVRDQERSVGSLYLSHSKTAEVPLFSVTANKPPAILCQLSVPHPTGWTKASVSLDASGENDGYSSAEEPLNSDPEEEAPKRLVGRRPPPPTTQIPNKRVCLPASFFSV